MTFTLRPYQRACVDPTLAYLRTSIEPVLIDAAPAAGKSFMVAAIANALYGASGKRVLCLAPSKELVQQNHGKYLLTGEPASIFSAAAGSKSTRHHVVFGTPQTVKNSISRFTSGYCAVIIDEAHGITPTIQAIIDVMREGNPNLRVIGLSGTPYRLGAGYIYRIDENDKPVTEARDPYFTKLIHRVSAQEMLDQGFITPMQIAETGQQYDGAAGLKPNRMGKFDPADLHSVFVGHGRKTAAIVADVVARSRDIAGGCMLFAATVEHCQEIMASLPPANAGFVTGDTASAMGGAVKGRDAVIEAYRKGLFKYLVSVGTLTTGFDVSHTATIATLRKTESAALLQQILGRAWRLDDNKPMSFWLDYAGNADEHFPDGDIYSPVIRANAVSGEAIPITCTCPDCGGENEFSGRKNPDGFGHDEHGYFVDLAGNRIETDSGPMPAHYGRRCLHMLPIGGGKLGQCQYRWTCKECPHCGADNDIAARYCTSCKGEIIDPNQKLVIEFKALKRSPYNRQCDKVLKCEVRDSVSQSGNPTKRVDIVTPYRSFSIWLQMKPRHNVAMMDLERWNALGGELPQSVEYRKEDSGFFRVYSWNKEPDIDPAEKH